MQLRSISILLSVLIVAPTLFSQKSSQKDLVTPLGRFSSIRQDGEHCSGYQVDLWQSKGAVLGIFRACAGMVGDMPLGLLENTHFDQTSHAVSFESTLSLGSDYLGKGKQVASQDKYTFDGRLDRRLLSGALTHVDEASPHPASSTQSVSLKKGKITLPRFASVDAFQANAQERIGKQKSKH